MRWEALSDRVWFPSAKLWSKSVLLSVNENDIGKTVKTPSHFNLSVEEHWQWWQITISSALINEHWEQWAGLEAKSFLEQQRGDQLTKEQWNKGTKGSTQVINNGFELRFKKLHWHFKVLKKKVWKVINNHVCEGTVRVKMVMMTVMTILEKRTNTAPNVTNGSDLNFFKPTKPWQIEFVGFLFTCLQITLNTLRR